jgi:hypothetical protein
MMMMMMMMIVMIVRWTKIRIGDTFGLVLCSFAWKAFISVIAFQKR